LNNRYFIKNAGMSNIEILDMEMNITLREFQTEGVDTTRIHLNAEVY
jgi:hypothetical protein